MRTRHFVELGTGYELLTAESPSLMEAGFTGLPKPTEEWPRLPHVVLRHRVSNDGKSVFVVVHEPYHNAPKIRSVSRLETGDDQLVALRIELPDRQDTLVYALDQPREVKIA